MAPRKRERGRPGERPPPRLNALPFSSQKSPSLASSNPGRTPGVATLINRQAQKAEALWTKAEWTALAKHLHNDNGPFAFVMGFSKDGKKKYVRSKKVPVDRAISWAWSTIIGKSKSGLAFVPYSTNHEQQSRWGGFDFDAHDGNAERAWRLAFAAFRHLHNIDLTVILESSGSNGWHLWVIAKEFWPVEQWRKFLKGVCRAIDCPIQSGICEVFPPDTLSRGFGKGLRAPGSWNPDTDTFSEILWKNSEPLIASLRPIMQLALSSSGSCMIKKEHYSFFSSSDTGGGLYARWEAEWKEQFSISTTATRNQKLCSLVGTVFHQIGRGMAERIARAQFEGRKAGSSKLEEHLADFERAWEGMHKQFLAELTAEERTAFDALTTENERDAFRIIRNYFRLVPVGGDADFPVAVADLGGRLGITWQGAGQLRKRFVRDGIIRPTAPFVLNVSAARFTWKLPFKDSKDETGNGRFETPTHTGAGHRSPEGDGRRRGALRK